MKTPVIQTSEYIIYIEEYKDDWFIHCDVTSKWNKTVKQNLIESFNLLTSQCDKVLYALHTPEDNKHKKFLKMFHFNYLKSIVGSDGKKYDIYIWR